MGRIGSITHKQKELLTEFMALHPDLQRGRFTNSFTFKVAQNLWCEITNILNSVPDGANKDWRQWRNTWQDLKKNVKAKVSENKKSANATGGGENSELPLDIIDSNILSMIPQESIGGLAGVNESIIQFNYEPHNEENINEVTEVEVIAGPSIIQNSEDHTYVMEDSCSSGNVKKKLTKTKRVQNSLKLSQQLLSILNKKGDMMTDYYNAKKQYYEHRKEYEEKKLELMKERHRCNCKCKFV